VAIVGRHRPVAPIPTNFRQTTSDEDDMAIKLGSLRTDLRKERDGDWVDIPELPGVKLKVRSFNYPPYETARNLLVQKLTRQYGKKPIPTEVLQPLFGELYAEHILVDWKGFDVAYSADVAQAELTEPSARDLRRHVEYAANHVADIEIAFTEEAAGNSEAVSGGRSNGGGTKTS
jgi:hypothetical protein